MKILLIPGHGGDDPGAVGNGMKEADINLDVTLALAPILRDSGHEVLLSRDRDTYISPNEQADMIRKLQPDAAIAIHCNAATTPEASGIEVIYADGSDMVLARHILDQLMAVTGLKSRGLKHESATPHKRLAVLRDLRTPTCLVELGFVTNKTDAVILKQTQLLAQGIAAALEAWS
jgi:N-acetylmuramoyl-L-alanine amidase